MTAEDRQTDRETDKPYLRWSAKNTGDLIQLVNFTHTRKQRLKSIQFRHYTTHRPDVDR